jgi:hypothetical protein
MSVIVYLSVNAGLLAMFARLWTIDRKLKARQPSA